MSHKNTSSALIKKLLSSSLFGIFVLFFFSATAVFAAQPSVSGLTIIYKSYISSPTPKNILPKTVKVSELITSYKNYISPVHSQDSTPSTLPPIPIPSKTSMTVSSLFTAYNNYIFPKP